MHYASRFERLSSGQAALDSATRQLIAQAESAADVTARIGETVQSTDELNRKNRKKIDEQTENLAKHDALLAGLSNSFLAVDRVVTTMGESLTRIEERAARIDQIGENLEFATAELETFKTQLQAMLDSIDQKPDMATVAAIGVTQQRVMEHLAELQVDHNVVKEITTSSAQDWAKVTTLLAELQHDHDAVKETVTSSAQDWAKVTAHLAELQHDHDSAKQIVTSTREQQQLIDKQEAQHRVRMTEFSQALEELQRATDADRNLTATIPEIRDRVADLAAHLAETARERTILAEEIDRLATARDDS